MEGAPEEGREAFMLARLGYSPSEVAAILAQPRRLEVDVAECSIELVPGEVQDILSDKSAQPTFDAAELRLARLVARGLTTRQMAVELGVDHRTVQRQVTRLRAKLGAGTKAELAVLLAEAGL